MATECRPRSPWAAPAPSTASTRTATSPAHACSFHCVAEKNSSVVKTSP